ncbi:MAG: transposase [Flavobacteriales bacterium Tduv]
MKKSRDKRSPAYSGISLFMMMLLSHWYDLSHVGTEELVKESLSCMVFCDLRLKDHILDHTIPCRFRNEIVAKKEYESLLKKINKELEKYQEIVKKGVIVYSSITVSPFAPKGNPTSVVEVGRKRDKSK